MAAHYTLKSTKNGQFMFNLHAGNNQVILTSETYKEKKSALGGIESVRKNSALDDRYNRKVAANGQHYFVLLAGNKEPIGKSEQYKSKSSMEKGIRSVKKNGPGAAVKDTCEG
ncbi:MAG: DUF1508 domain-containing protein [Acidobacteria bacterium]|nr:DUF1508 domain-containing protein [Acidobacteriota bacterium]